MPLEHSRRCKSHESLFKIHRRRAVPDSVNSPPLVMVESQRQSVTITLLVVHAGELSNSYAESSIVGADEIIEVGARDKCWLPQGGLVGIKYRHIEPRVRGLAHALNLGASFASSEWIVISFGDERVVGDWLNRLRGFLAIRDQRCAYLFHSDSGSEIPLIVVRRAAFVYGPFDERFACGRLTALHWISQIFPRQTRRIWTGEGVSRHRGELIESGPCPQVEAPLIGLIELWHELQPRNRVALLEQVIASPDAGRQSLDILLDAARKDATAMVDPYRSGAAYEAKRFWEANSTDYIRWEIYQPDEPEILALMERVAPPSVLELGCGAGRNTRYFAGTERYAGIDLSMNLLRRAVERQEPNSLGILCGDITELPFADAAFELVFSDSTVQHVTPDRIGQCVSEIVRVSAEYVCVIEYTEEDREDGKWFSQIHMFAHDYRRLFEPYCELVWHTDTALRVHPARKEVFLFRKREHS